MSLSKYTTSTVAPTTTLYKKGGDDKVKETTKATHEGTSTRPPP